MRINNNMMAQNAHRYLSSASSNMSKSLEKISSGLRINSAADDAAGLAISEKMRAQISGLEQAATNAQNGISLIQTAEGALNETHSILQRMRQLAVNSSNDTNTETDRAEIQKEVDELASELTRISENTEFNTENLLDGTFEAKFHIGANQGQNMSLTIEDMSSTTLGVARMTSSPTTVGGFEVANTSGSDISIIVEDPGANDSAFESTLDETAGTLTISLATDGTGAITSTNEDVLNAINAENGLSATYADGTTSTDTTAAVASTSVATATYDDTKGIDVSTDEEAASNAISVLDDAISTVSAERSKLGAYQNRLEHTINNLSTTTENLQASESRIRDVDVAKEMMEFTKLNILSQASQSMLAQANQAPQGVLQLLG